MVVKFITGVFIKDENARGFYIPYKQPQLFPFPFLRVEPTKTDAVKNNGAKLVIQSFVKVKSTDKVKTKILHSGLIRLNDFEEVHFGDNINLTKQKDFFIVELKNNILTMYYFKKRNPKNKVKFSKQFLQGVRKN